MAENLNGLNIAENYRRHNSHLYSYAFSLVGNADVAQELVSTAWLKFISTGLEKYDSKKSNVGTYIHRIIHNAWVDDLRKSKKIKFSSIDEFLDGSDFSTAHCEELSLIEQEECGDLIMRVLNRLPKKYNVVLLSRYIGGLDINQIAERENLTNSTIRWRLHKARERFKKEYLALVDK